MSIKLKPNKIKEILVEMLCAVLLFILYLQFTTTSMALYYLKFIVAAILWCVFLIKTDLKKKNNIYIAVFIIVVLFFSIFGYAKIQIVFVSLPLALVLLQRDRLNCIIWSLLPFMIAANTIYAWTKSTNKYILYSGMSRNYVSVFLLLSLAIYNLSREKSDLKCPVVIPILTFMGAVSALGRGGIVSCGIVLLLFIFERFKKDAILNRKYILKVGTLVLAIIAVSVYIYSKWDYISINYLGRFFGTESSALSSTEARMDNYVYYVMYCLKHPMNLFMGVNPDISLLGKGNLHNSFLQLHSQFGIGGVIIFVVLIVKSIRYLCIYKKYDSVIILIGILIRGMFDWCFPGFPLDVILLYYIFLPILRIKSDEKVV